MGELVQMIDLATSIRSDLASGKLRTRDGQFECIECFNSGWREVIDPQGSVYRGVVKCTRCRYWEFRQTNRAENHRI